MGRASRSLPRGFSGGSSPKGNTGTPSGKRSKELSSCGKNHADLGEFPPSAVLALFVASGGKLSPAPVGATYCG